MKAKDVRKGQVVIYKGQPHRVAETIHRTPGNLRAFVQMKLRNVVSGVMLEDRFSSFDELDQADMEQFQATYLYSDESGHHFMNTSSYDQIALQDELVGDTKYYLQEGLNVQISLFEERPIGIDIPKTVILTVVETPPELKGATATNVNKPATTNTGLTVAVPPFIKNGERIIVDTTDGSYLSRAD
jgi:elongation factor P